MTLDLDAYLARIGWTGEPGDLRPTPEVLRSLHHAHLLGIPFENLEPVLGSAPSLALDDLEAKLVRSERGGYCYEHNTLFSAVLKRIGFGVTPLTARVLLGAAPGDIRPRTHMLMRVDVPGAPRPYLADVGFGVVGALLEPIELVEGAELSVAPRHHRLVHAPHDGPLPMWELQAEKDGFWEAQYAFTLEPFEAPDYEVINWHIATHPRSPFRQAVYANRTRPGSHLALSGLALVETADDGTVGERQLKDGAEALRVLADDFGVRLPEGTRLPE
ncbi:arylamine N-acetyltransferase [Streptomyces sp. C11-1]|uniref:Arylamine N-acetyltransferase n=1 Tax=Streptomyces durocortorensis TaxID=2811104 RepID=A0ABY9VZL4_9ACTN|nr:arylamine N-acetyltransferase [Streptomyces durocortorensis]WNF29223.1 arylamine N-acetyltransferase [Streptomyces durocortorensis]